MATCQPYQAGKQQQQQEQHLHQVGCALPSVYSGTTVLLPRQASLAPPPTGPEPSLSSGRSATEERALKIHSESERRRRERINAHLATLRRMIPDAGQMDKATLLARVVNQVKDLRRKAAEVTPAMPVPSEVNEVTVQCYTEQSRAAGDDRSTYIRASISCDDRPELVADIARAFHALRLRALRADMISVGGRTRHVFILCREEGNVGACLKSLKEAVRQALANVAFPEMVYSGSSRSKKQMILESHYSTLMYSI